MAAELTDEQIEAAVTKAVKAGKLPWAGFREDEEGRFTLPVLSRVHYGLVRLGLSLATQQAAQGAEPDGWLYVMHMEGGQTNKSFSEERYDFPTHSPFGRRGRDYSEEYEVTEHPICIGASPQPPAAQGAEPVVCPDCGGRLEYDKGEPWDGPSTGCVDCGITVDVVRRGSLPSASVVNVLRVALDRADMNHRATGFKDFEIDAAKAWVCAASPQPSTGTEKKA